MQNINETDRQVEDLIRRSAPADIPVEVEDRLRLRLTELQAKIERRRTGSLRSLPDWWLRAPAMAAAALALVLTVMVLPLGSNAGRAYAQAAAQFRTARSVQYKIVLAPFTEAEFSYLAPRFRRVNLSWGIEIRTDDTGRQVVLLHGTRQYAIEASTNETLRKALDLVEQLRALPRKADEVLGDQQAGAKRLTGYRLRRLAPGSGIDNLKAMDLWVDQKTGDPDHVDVTIQEPGKPEYAMHVKDIRLDGVLDPSQFSTIPPAGYTPVTDTKPRTAADVRPEIREVAAFTAVVVPMKGPYSLSRTVVGAVELSLKQIGVTPSGPAFGRFGSEQAWEAGYPVGQGVRVESPLQVVTVPAATVASAVVPGAWGQETERRWASFLQWSTEQGYVPAGPPMEFWRGEDSKAETQSTEMRLAVRKAN